MTDKKAFLFYASNLDVIEQFPEEEAKRIAMIIVEYGFSDGNFECSEKECLMLDQVFAGIDAEKRRYHDVQLVESYISRIELFSHKCSDVSDATTKKVLTALRKLKNRVRRENIDNLPNLIMEMIRSDFSEILGKNMLGIAPRFEDAIAVASFEDRTKLQEYYDRFLECRAYLDKYEAEHPILSGK